MGRRRESTDATESGARVDARPRAATSPSFMGKETSHARETRVDATRYGVSNRPRGAKDPGTHASRRADDDDESRPSRRSSRTNGVEFAAKAKRENDSKARSQTSERAFSSDGAKHSGVRSWRRALERAPASLVDVRRRDQTTARSKTFTDALSRTERGVQRDVDAAVAETDAR